MGIGFVVKSGFPTNETHDIFAEILGEAGLGLRSHCEKGEVINRVR